MPVLVQVEVYKRIQKNWTNHDMILERWGANQRQSRVGRILSARQPVIYRANCVIIYLRPQGPYAFILTAPLRTTLGSRAAFEETTTSKN